MFATRTDSLEVEVHDSVAWVRLNRPDKLNALDESMEAALEGLWPRLKPENGVRAVVMSGAGRAFCAGADVTEMQQRPLRSDLIGGQLIIERARERDRLRWAFSNVVAWSELPVPTIAVVHGVAAGAGLALACAADFRLAAEGARFLAAYGRLGLCGDWGLTATLPDLVGLRRARRMLLLGEEVTSAEALESGLVDEVLAEERLEERAEAFSSALSGRATTAISETKRLLRQRRLGDVIQAEIESTLLCQETEDYAEGLDAFKEKREPRFKGI